MQTFLPYKDFKKSLNCLDYRRLGKQRVEAMQILNILLGKTKSNAWKNHPIVLMWNGYEKALTLYMNLAIEFWIKRGYNNNMIIQPIKGKIILPNWLGNKKIHDSHKSNLLRKFPEHYKKFGWKIPNNLPYIWENLGNPKER